MIGVIRSELRKNIRRPAVLVALGFVSALVLFAYAIGLYGALNNSAGAPSILTLYPDQLVNNVTGAAGLSAAIAMIVGAVVAGSDYSWGSFKTSLTQRAGRLTTVFGRIAGFLLVIAALTSAIFVAGAIASALVALYQGHAVSWPAAIDIAKGFGAIWLLLSSSGLLGMALGTLFRQPAAAVAVGLIYGLAIQLALARFVADVDGRAYRWLADLFEGQNSSALMQSFTSPAFGPTRVPEIAAGTAVLVLACYVFAYVLATAALVQRRDVT